MSKIVFHNPKLPIAGPSPSLTPDEKLAILHFLPLTAMIGIFTQFQSDHYSPEDVMARAFGVVSSMLTHKELSSLFSSKRIKDVSNGDLNFVIEVANSNSLGLGESFNVSEVFEASFRELSKHYRGEYFFKNIVTQKILLGRHSMNTATAISEFRVGKSKADCVIINGNSTCYEIKSDFDNLDRLDNQLHHYQKIFDKVYVVTSEKHVQKILKKENASVGIIELSSRNSLRVIREAIVEHKEIDARTLIRSLRVAEYTEIVRHIYNYIPAVSNTDIFFECESLLTNAAASDVRAAFCKVIKKTRKIEKEFITALPKSMLTAGISYKLSRGQQASLIKNLNIKLSRDTSCTFQY